MNKHEEQIKLKELGVSQRRAARHIGVTEAQLSRMVNRTAGHVPSQSLLSYIGLLEEMPESERKAALSKLDHIADQKEKEAK